MFNVLGANRPSQTALYATFRILFVPGGQKKTWDIADW